MISLSLKTGWLSKSGEFIACKECDHLKAAEEILTHMNIPFRHADDKLFKLGWARIGISYARDSIQSAEWLIDWANKLTPEQIAFLKPYFNPYDDIEENCLFHWADEVINNIF